MNKPAHGTDNRMTMTRTMMTNDDIDKVRPPRKICDSDQSLSETSPNPVGFRFSTPVPECYAKFPTKLVPFPFVSIGKQALAALLDLYSIL